MIKTTQKVIRSFVSQGLALDITNQVEKIAEPVTREAFSRGVYGCNGLLLRGLLSGNYYAICSRSSALFYYL